VKMMSTPAPLPHAQIVHQSGQRTRFRLPSCKGDPDYFAMAERALKLCEGVTAVETNPFTGSILVLHTTDRAQLIEYAEKTRLFTLTAPTRPSRSALAEASQSIDRLDAHLQRISGGAFALDETLFAALVGLSLLQVARGQIISPASTLLTNAALILSYYRARQNK
jgi:hypothetical protein